MNRRIVRRESIGQLVTPRFGLWKVLYVLQPRIVNTQSCDDPSRQGASGLNVSQVVPELFGAVNKHR